MDKTMIRLYHAAKELAGLDNQAGIARALNTSSQTVKNWEARGISKQGLLSAQKIFGVSAQWLETGEGDMAKDRVINVAEVIETGTDTDKIEIQVFDNVRFFAGNGQSGDIELYRSGKNLETTTLNFPVVDFLKSGADPTHCVCVKVSGKSMEPIIPDGATIGIDKSKNQIKDGGLHAFLLDGTLKIKELQMLSGNKVKIKSYNPSYDDDCASLDDLVIIGRVFWWSVLVSL